MNKSVHTRSRSRSFRRTVSADLTDFIKKQYPTKIPINTITGLSKLYCKKKATNRQSKILKRTAQSATHLHTAKFLQNINNDASQFKKGSQLSDEQTKKMYLGFCNPQGKLTFEYLMKMGQQSNFPLSQKVAKGIIRKYGRRKQFLNLEDCQKVLKRHNDNTNSKKYSPRNTPRNNINSSVKGK